MILHHNLHAINFLSIRDLASEEDALFVNGSLPTTNIGYPELGTAEQFSKLFTANKFTLQKAETTSNFPDWYKGKLKDVEMIYDGVKPKSAPPPILWTTDRPF
ncbi:protein of unknown function [Pseudodesulfovibrio profundus]|uniref:Uncharacterized protein n=1 Tax=Pseudodesulfovibrio profundus TaxID=57320 RepID=A0A2C8F7V3_9BACT|nr:hypothetical protein [Pseudodesulfovibrio profundus]SOB58716.1 protein of unknown function [Pseudodesulfovibrio profundus]